MADLTGFASTSPLRSAGATRVSIQRRRSFRRSPPIPFSPRRASSPNRGTSAQGATASASFPPRSPTGTIASATPRAASGAATPGCAARSRPGWRVRATSFRAPPAPSNGVNFVGVHDGFTLRDLVSYEHKHNEANGENNRDGTDNNNSWNHGVEGPSDDPAILKSRARDERNLLTLLLASRGTPMLSMGSELGFSQGGNNNAYAQNNATSAIDWRAADVSLIGFTARLIAARRDNAALSRDAFLTGSPFDASQLPDVEWRDANGPMTQVEWNDAEGAVFAVVFAAPQDGDVDRVAVAMNRSNANAEVRLPSPRSGMAWRILIDTRDSEAPERWLALADLVRLRARSSLILAEARTAGGGLNSGAPGVETIGKLASAAGVAAEWSDIAGKRTIVSPETKIALLSGLGLEVSSEAQARDSLTKLIDETAAPSPALLAGAARRRAARRSSARHAEGERCADRA